jgi:hypothetical protein
MSQSVVDPLLELAYSQFEAARELRHDLTVLQVLEQYVSPNYRDAVFQRWTEQGIVISRPEATVVRGEPAKWRPNYNSNRGKHWVALQTFLQVHGGRTSEQVLALDRASDKVLFGIGDPSVSLTTDRRDPGDSPGIGPQKFAGLVIGYVQSGKTANYTALAAKAYDAGYELVIVLTGIHNALRRQTQIRMNNELGLLQSTAERPTAATGFGDSQDVIMELTSEDLLTGDFKYVHLDSQKALARGKHLCVTKKNASVLRALIAWLGKEVRVPTLIIDDEADQASINTASPNPEDEIEDDYKPTTINGLIRDLKNLCIGHCAYVAYTATPYANVFIDMDADTDTHHADLYPENFIISLPKPEGYMGPQEFFGPQLSGEETDELDLSSRVIRILDKAEEKELRNLHSPHSVKSEFLTENLSKSIRQFILATAARREVTGKSLPSSFLVHTSSAVKDQENLGRRISLYVDQLNTYWRYNRAPLQLMLEDDWKEFCSEMSDGDFDIPFLELEKQLDNLIGRFEGLQVKILNFRSGDDLDYELNPDMVSIIVGGNKLSRGLTLEGLLFSYFVRKTAKEPQADTLTQMGRFFGYRREIVDLTRVFTTDKLRNDFREISQMEEALRADIALYEKTGKTPRDFAPRVQRRAGIMPTAANRMRSAVAQGVSYSGDLIQTTSFDNSVNAVKIAKKNYSVTCDFLKEVDAVGTKSLPLGANSGSNRKLWKQVPGSLVLSFISDFSTVDGANRFVSRHISTYIRDLLHHSDASELKEWSVAVIGRSPVESLGVEGFGSSENVGRLNRSLDVGSDRSIGTLINPLGLTDEVARGDEIIDFTSEELEHARNKVIDENIKAAQATRSMRPKNRGLLLVYPLSPASIGVSEGTNQQLTLGAGLFGDTSEDTTIVGLSIVFPESDLELNQYWRQGKIMESI